MAEKKLKPAATHAFRGHRKRDEQRAERAKPKTGPNAHAVARGFRGHAKPEAGAAHEARLEGLAKRATKVLKTRD